MDMRSHYDVIVIGTGAGGGTLAPVCGWLLGPFALAHLRVNGDPRAAQAFLEPMAHRLADYGVGSLAELFDGDPPFTPRGCIAQARSVSETLRAWLAVAASDPAGRRGSQPA